MDSEQEVIEVQTLDKEIVSLRDEIVNLNKSKDELIQVLKEKMQLIDSLNAILKSLREDLNTIVYNVKTLELRTESGRPS